MINILKYLTPKSQVSCLNSEMSVRQGLEKFRAHGYTSVPVINEDGTYYGVISEGDFLWDIVNNDYEFIQQLENKKIKDMVHKKVPSCKMNMDIDDIISFITNYNFVPIVDDRNILMGIITRKSIINFLRDKEQNQTL